MAETAERLATLESESETHGSKINELSLTVKSIDENVGKILIQMANNRGFFHGVVFTLSILGGLIGAFATEIWHKVVGT